MPELELVSVHVPKTGGTSFWEAVSRHYGEALVEDNDHIPGTTADLSEPPVLPEFAKAVHGHFRADRYADFVNAFHITFLREPNEQFISNYFFWLTYPPHGNALHDRLLAERPDIVTYARNYTGSILAGFFEGVDVNLFDYVGFGDRRLQDYRVLSRMLGFHIDARIHSNRTELPAELEAQRKDVTTNPRILAELKDALREDYRYYDLFRSRWT